MGSRRTVYLSEDEPKTVAAPMNNQNQSPLLVYNKISTVIGDAARSSAHQKVPEDGGKEGVDKKEVENAKETAVWYEYGCV